MKDYKVQSQIIKYRFLARGYDRSLIEKILLSVQNKEKPKDNAENVITKQVGPSVLIILENLKGA